MNLVKLCTYTSNSKGIYYGPLLIKENISQGRLQKTAPTALLAGCDSAHRNKSHALSEYPIELPKPLPKGLEYILTVRDYVRVFSQRSKNLFPKPPASALKQWSMEIRFFIPSRVTTNRNAFSRPCPENLGSLRRCPGLRIMKTFQPEMY